MFCPVFNIKNFPNIVYMLFTYLLYKEFYFVKAQTKYSGRVIPTVFEIIYQEVAYFHSFVYLLALLPCCLSPAVEGAGAFQLRWMLRFLTVLAAPVEHRLGMPHARASAAAAVATSCGSWALEHRLSSCGAWA